MSSPAVTLDFSKSVPLEGNAPKANLDFSKAQAIPNSAQAQPQATPEQTAQQREQNASDTRMSALSGLTGMPTPNMTAQQRQDFAAGKESGTKAGLRDAATMAIAGPVASKISGAVKAATAAQPITQSVGTGIVDSAGREIMKDVTTMGPSMVSQAFSNPLVQKGLMRAAVAGSSLIGAAWLGKILKLIP